MWSSDAVEGPYKPCKVNPILTQRDLPGDLKVRFTSHGKDVSFFYAEDGKDWQSLGGVQDASILSTDHAGGFVAATIGPLSSRSERPGNCAFIHMGGSLPEGGFARMSSKKEP